MDKNPHTHHTMRERPMDPASINTPLGLTKMPEPMMMPMIMATPSSKPNSFLRWIEGVSSFSLTWLPITTQC